MASTILTTRTARILLITVALVAAGVTTISLVRHQQPTRIGVFLGDITRSSKADTFLHLTFQEFRPAGNQFAGALQIDVAPNLDRFEPADIKQWAESYKQLVLRISHYDAKINLLTYQGGSDDRIAVSAPPAWGAFRGKGNFTWTAVPDNGPFFYPFDRYTLHLNPALMEVSNPALYPIVQINSIETDFGNSNFIPHLQNLNAKYPSDPYDITLDRPILLRTLALIVAALFILWLIYLIWSAKPGEQAGQVVTLFVGVFSIRSSLLSGAPLFPSLIDYCALAVYLAATLIVLIRWMLPGKSTKDCPFCASPIPLAATVCPQCTRKLSPPAEKSA